MNFPVDIRTKLTEARVNARLTARAQIIEEKLQEMADKAELLGTEPELEEVILIAKLVDDLNTSKCILALPISLC